MSLELHSFIPLLSTLNSDCPQSSGSSSTSSQSLSSGSATIESRSSCNCALEMLSKSLRGGSWIVVHAKYSIMWNAAMGLSNTDPLSSAIMYASPLFLASMMSGLRYCGRIFLLRAFSIAVFHTSTRSPSLKLKLCIVLVWSSSNLIAAFTCVPYTLSCKLANWSLHFCDVMALHAIRSVVVNVVSGGGNR